MIEVNNTNQNAEVAQDVDATFRETLQATMGSVEMDFRFREVVRGDERYRRAPLRISVPVLSPEAVALLFRSGGKNQQLIIDTLNEVFVTRARQVISDNESLTSDNFPAEELDWTRIANLPKGERSSIPTEQFEAFAKAYVVVMQPITKLTIEQLTSVAQLFAKKLNSPQVKSDKKLVARLAERLAQFADSCPDPEEHAIVLEFLINKCERLLNLKEQAVELDAI